MKQDVIKERITQLLGLKKELPQELWAYLEKKGFVSKTENGEISLKELKEEILDFLEASGQIEKYLGPDRVEMIPTDRKKRITDRNSALSLHIADLMRKNSDVIQFRKRVLSNKLLKEEEVEDWISTQAEREGKPTMFLQDVVFPKNTERDIKYNPEGYLRETLDPPISEILPAGSKLKYLEYTTPRLPYSMSVPVAAEGILHELFELTEKLAKDTGWLMAQATVFVLADKTPQLAPLRARMTQHSLWVEHKNYVLRRIFLDLDPTITATELADYYRRVRKEFIKTKPRKLSEKTINLVSFVLNNRNLKWKQLQEKWNKEFPKWSYSEDNASNFRRDYAMARLRILPRGRDMEDFMKEQRKKSAQIFANDNLENEQKPTKKRVKNRSARKARITKSKK